MLVLDVASLILPWSHLTIEALVHIGEHLLSILIRGALAKSDLDGGHNDHDDHNDHDNHGNYSDENSKKL